MARKTDSLKKKKDPEMRTSSGENTDDEKTETATETKWDFKKGSEKLNFKFCEVYDFEKSKFYEDEQPKHEDIGFKFYESALMKDKVAESFQLNANLSDVVANKFNNDAEKNNFACNHNKLLSDNRSSVGLHYDYDLYNRIAMERLKEVRNQNIIKINEEMTENSTQTAFSKIELKDSEVQVILKPSDSRRTKKNKYITWMVLVILSLFIGAVLSGYLAFGKTKNNKHFTISTSIETEIKHNGISSDSILTDPMPLKTDDPSVKQIVILFRHGDRTPTETYANDPHKTYVWEGGWGALTKKGMKRMYKLGQWIRQKYGWLNDGKYNKSNTYVESSYSDRCIESSQSLLAGLYPVTSKDAFVENFPWRPIPVHYTPRNFDKVIVVKFLCPKIGRLLADAYNKSLTPDLTKYLNELSNIAGQKMETITDVEFLYNTLEIEVKEGLELPEKMKEYYEDPRMLKIAQESYAIFTDNNEQKKLTGGPLLNNILNNIKNFNDGKSKYNIYLYGVHDITLVNLLRTMGISKFNGELLKPNLGATLVFENRKTDENSPSTIRLLYMDDSSTEELVPLKIPDCTNFPDECKGELKNVSWDGVRRNFKNYISDDWDGDCNISNNGSL